LSEEEARIKKGKKEKEKARIAISSASTFVSRLSPNSRL
jgi:hypothetical protein